MELYDVIIIGGGPAGMSAALILGRCRRKILIFDEGRQRNKKARLMHGYLSRDGIAPAEFREQSLRDLGKYYITLKKSGVTDLEKEENLFKVSADDGETYFSRKVLLAAGLQDNIPPIEGIEEYYGISIHHCPICDGWETADKEIVMYGQGSSVMNAALHLRHWSRKITIVSDGPHKLSRTQVKKLEGFDVHIRTEKITGLTGRNGWLSAVRFNDGPDESCQAMFFATGYRAHWRLPDKLNPRYRKKDELWVDHLQQSNIEGLYVAGDAACDMKLVIIAAADGAKAAVAIHNSLYKEETEM